MIYVKKEDSPSWLWVLKLFQKVLGVVNEEKMENKLKDFV